MSLVSSECICGIGKYEWKTIGPEGAIEIPRSLAAEIVYQAPDNFTVLVDIVGQETPVEEPAKEAAASKTKSRSKKAVEEDTPQGDLGNALAAASPLA